MMERAVNCEAKVPSHFPSSTSRNAADGDSVTTNRAPMPRDVIRRSPRLLILSMAIIGARADLQPADRAVAAHKDCALQRQQRHRKLGVGLTFRRLLKVLQEVELATDESLVQQPGREEPCA